MIFLENSIPKTQESQQTKLGYIPSLDGLRALAIILVFLVHFHPDATLGPAWFRAINRFLDLGWCGVSLFFVLSGFLISGILWETARESSWLRRFYIRRSLRIFPLYYAVLIALTLVAIFNHYPLKLVAKISINFLYLSNVPFLRHQAYGFPYESALAHFWSLAVEEQFYLLWPAVIYLVHGKRQNFLIICLLTLIGSLAFRSFAFLANWNWQWAHQFIFARCGELSAGAFLAVYIRTRQIDMVFIRFSLIIATVSFLALLCIANFSEGLTLMDPLWNTLGIFVFSFFFASLVVFCLVPGVFQRFFEIQALRWLGRISYGIYVYHIVLMQPFDWLTNRLISNVSLLEFQLARAVINAIGTLVIASLSFYFFEKPIIGLKDRFAKG